MSDVGITRCNGKNCYVSCGCNTSKGWYLAPSGGKDSSKTSARSYDYVIGDDGELASTGKTLSGTSRTLNSEGSSKTLAAGSTAKCYKQTCSVGFTRGEPNSFYFNYDTETLDDGSKCYRLKAGNECKCTESAADIGDTYFNYSCPTYAGKTCCNVTSCKYSPSSTYFNRSDDTACSTTCYKATSCKSKYANKTIASGTTGQTSNGIECYDVLCSDENANWYSSTGGYSHYDDVSSQSSYENTCYANRHNADWYCNGSSYPYDSTSEASPHYATSTTASKKCDVCGRTTTGTCYADKSHNYPTPEGYSSSCSSGYYYAAQKDVKCNVTTGCTSEKTFYKCAACPTKVTVGSCEKSTSTFTNSRCNSGVAYDTGKRYYYHSEACGTNYTAEPDGKECTAYTPTCSNGNTYTCYKDCKDKVQYYTIHIHKSFGAECPSNYSGAFNGINGGCSIGGQNCSTSSNMYTADNVAEGSTFSVTEPACYSNSSDTIAYLSGCSGNGCRMTASEQGGYAYDLSATITQEQDITFTYSCRVGTCEGSPTICPENTSTSAPSTSYFNLSDHTYNQGYPNEYTCWGVTSCATSRGAYSTSPNTTYFTVSSSTMYGKTCYRATGCQSGYSSSGTGAGGTASGYTCKKVSSGGSTGDRPDVCEDSSYYDGHPCDEFPDSAVGSNCAREYQSLGQECMSLGSKPGEVNNRCNVDSWNRCCLYCNGRGPT